MRFIKKNKLLIFILVMVLALPVLLVANNNSQDNRGRAQASTSIYFSPTTTNTSPLAKNAGDNFPMDVMIAPGQNYLSSVKIEIDYDPSKIGLSSDPVNINTDAFPQILEGPVYSSGKIQVILSIGSDQTRYISTETRILTLNLKAIASSKLTQLSFGSITSAYSIAQNDSGNENVISTMIPAYLKISKSTSGSSQGKGNKPR